MLIRELLALTETKTMKHIVAFYDGDTIVGYIDENNPSLTNDPGKATSFSKEDALERAEELNGEIVDDDGGQGEYKAIAFKPNLPKGKMQESVKFKTAVPLRRGYTVDLNDTEYKTLRKAKMSGDFSHPYKTVEVAPGHNNVTFKTSDPKKLARDLEKIIDAGETSWAEILNIA